MTTISKALLVTLALSTTALAQSAPRKSQTKPSSAAASQNGKNQKETTAKTSHPSTMSGNHKDMMMSAARDPGTGGKTQSATQSAPTPNTSKK